jgi:hypothetical protein
VRRKMITRRAAYAIVKLTIANRNAGFVMP